MRSICLTAFWIAALLELFYGSFFCRFGFGSFFRFLNLGFFF